MKFLKISILILAFVGLYYWQARWNSTNQTTEQSIVDPLKSIEAKPKLIEATPEIQEVEVIEDRYVTERRSKRKRS